MAEIGLPLTLASIRGRRSLLNVSGMVDNSPILQLEGSDCAMAALENMRAANATGLARRVRSDVEIEVIGSKKMPKERLV